MEIQIETLTIQKAHDHLVAGDFTAVELAKECLSRVEKSNQDINAYVEIFDDVRVRKFFLVRVAKKCSVRV
jgi:Asp-tRNA(Asn)/Glu-tRNA(Gln) amidotransferase A subunit family amidase